MTMLSFTEVPALVEKRLQKSEKIILISSLIIFFMVSVSLFQQWKRSLDSESSLIIPKPSQLQFCSYVIPNILSGNYEKDMINDETFSSLFDEQFHVNVDKIILIHAPNSESCAVTIQDSKGLLRFNFKLDKYEQFNHGYKVIDIREERLKKVFTL